MSETKLGVGQLLAGGWGQILRCKGRAIFWSIAFAVAQFSYSLLERVGIAFVATYTSSLNITGAEFLWFLLPIYLIGQALLSVLATMSLMGQNIFESLGEGSIFRLVGAAIVAFIVASIGIFIGFVFLIIPGLLLASRWYLVVPLMVTGRSRLGAAFSDSWDAMDGNVGNTVGVILVMYIPVVILSGTTVTFAGLGAYSDIPYLAVDAILGGATAVFGIAVSVYLFRKLIDNSDEVRAVFS